MDYYLNDKKKLRGKPKETIGMYVQSQGFLVPRIFDSLKEARKSHKSILIRSEHEQDYDGISGLLDSFCLADNYYSPRGSKSIQEIKEKYFYWSENDKKGLRAGTPLYKQWAKSIDRDLNKIRQEIDFSIWEKLNGLNRKVIADDSIPNRWYVMTEGRFSPKEYISNTVIFQDGKIKNEFGMSNCFPQKRKMPEELRQKIPSLIQTYEKIRNLPNFDPNHCPEMEFQFHNGKDYFLQYHRIRDYKERTFVLDRPKEKNEIILPFVRGTNKEEGEIYDVTVYYGKDEKGHEIFDGKDEDGSWDFHLNRLFSEIESRKRKIQMTESRNNDFEWKIRSVCGNHDSFSQMFKPQINAMIDHKSLLFPGETIDSFYKERKNGFTTPRSKMLLKVVADGEKGYIERIQ